MKLQEMKNLYLENIKLNLANATYKFYNSHLNYIFKYFKNQNIIEHEDLDKEIIYNFITFQKEHNVKNATINKRIMCLKNMFKFNCIKNETLLDLKKFKEEINTFNTLNKIELENLINYLNSNKLKEQNKLIIYLLIDTGIRLNELLHIKISNINFTNNTILLEITKTHRIRVVPFTEATAFLLKDYIDNNSFENDYLINLSKSGVESLFQRIKDKLNLNKFHPHMLRHTLATKLHRNSVSLIIIQKIMGHTNVSTTQRYIHINIDDIVNTYNQVMN